jgi:RHS repeat-associated protein
LNGKVIAQRSGASDLIYLHSDHLGSTGVVTNWWNGGVVSSQKYDPWGKVRGGTGTITQTTISYTGQRLDGTGLLYYNARYYDPNVAKFVSADTIVPGTADGSGGSAATLGYDDKVALRLLTVGFHETQFATALNEENRFTQDKGFYFQLGDKSNAKYQWGVSNPQALNRYAYTINNPVKFVDLTGHVWIYVDSWAGKVSSPVSAKVLYTTLKEIFLDFDVTTGLTAEIGFGNFVLGGNINKAQQRLGKEVYNFLTMLGEYIASFNTDDFEIYYGWLHIRDEEEPDHEKLIMWIEVYDKKTGEYVKGRHYLRETKPIPYSDILGKPTYVPNQLKDAIKAMEYLRNQNRQYSV